MWETFELTLSNGVVQKGCKWPKAGSKKNVVIITGMAESSYRYDEFALYLNKAGYSVYCLDHYGQGLNCEKPEELGIWPENGFEEAVQFVYEEVKFVKETTGNPVYLFGHSMGSFVNQRFIQLHGDEVVKTVICGSCDSMGIAASVGSAIARSRAKKLGRNFVDKTLDKLMFGSYLKKIKNPKTPVDWLSTNDDNNQKYLADWRQGAVCTSGFYADFTTGLTKVHKNNNIKSVPATLPIFLIAGNEDPVGKYGKGVANKCKQYQKLGKNAKVKLYPGMRHEILNEIGREQVMKDIVEFYAL